MAANRRPAAAASRNRVTARSGSGRRAGKRSRRLSNYAWLLLLVIPALVFVLRYGARQSPWLYPSLGAVVPRGFGAVGLDVSRWNGRIRWDQVPTAAVRTDFVWIKATEGLQLKDPEYKRNRKGSEQAGLYSGAYHFFLPSLDAVGQARHFWNTAQLTPGDLPPVLDLETDGRLEDAPLREAALRWFREMERLCDCKPVLYTNQHFYRRIVARAPDSAWINRTIWIAAYGHRELPLLQQDSRIRFWQFSDEGRVNGIREAVDLNVFRGDTAELRMWIRQSWNSTAIR